MTAKAQDISQVEVVLDKGRRPGGYTVARFRLGGEPHVGIRWNEPVSASAKDISAPPAEPEWFVVPDDIAPAVLERAQRLEWDEEAILEGYRAMAADEEREREAFVWIESSVGECL